MNLIMGRLFRELEYFKEKEVQEINVLDPIFNLSPNHYLEICRKIDILGLQTRFYLQCRLELLCRKDGEQFWNFVEITTFGLNLVCKLFGKRSLGP